MAAHGNPDIMMQLYLLNTGGDNFLINPKGLETSFWVPNRFKAEYLGFASFRSYDDYKSKGLIDLEISRLPPWVPLQVAQQNPLLTVTDKYIKFNKEK